MLRYLWNKNKKLFKISAYLIAATLIIGTLFVIDACQKEQRAKNSNGIEISEYSGDIPEYDVSGMTDEEVREFIKELRNNEK